MSVLICPYDGTSRIAGAALGAKRLWREAFSPQWADARVVVQRLEIESRSSAIYCRCVSDVAMRSAIRLAIGGEHLITFPLVEVMYQKHPRLKLIVWDAHHDAYPYPLATHYSVFYHLLHELNIPTLFLGARYELEKAFRPVQVMRVETLKSMGTQQFLDRIQNFLGGNPFYLSTDLDVIDPAEFPAVASPVPHGVRIAQFAEQMIALLRLQPVGADIVEYNAVKDGLDGRSITALQPVLYAFGRWIRYAQGDAVANH